jgi:hypothetical protein
VLRRPAVITAAVCVILCALLVANAVHHRVTVRAARAATPEAAVEGFWRSIARHDYEAATGFYPEFARRSGRARAAAELRSLFTFDPLIGAVTVSPARAEPGTHGFLVGFEGRSKAGRIRGEFVVGRGADGYVITGRSGHGVPPSLGESSGRGETR